MPGFDPATGQAGAATVAGLAPDTVLSDADAPDTALSQYYARRATAYERIYAKPERQADLRAIEALLPALFAGRDVLEIACGTGWWTPFGARDCRSWLATDINDETLAIARTKPLPAGRVRFARIDAWTLDGLAVHRGPADGATAPENHRFDAAFAGFWWSHVPLERLPAWLALLHDRLKPGAIVAMLDNRFVPGSSTLISRRDSGGNTWQERVLDDGSRHEVLKNFPDPAQAIAALGGRARDARWTAFEHFWLLTYRL
jgi:demethylmenaquinone methyltransferase/2-methoxy-6-polyprenyl-1,4-benzoquinol methylase